MMCELLRSNDLVKLSWAEAMLSSADIGSVIFDDHMSALEGSIMAFQRRLMVLDEDFERARRLLEEAETALLQEPDRPAS